jgi:hypothetical protein
MRVIDGMRHHSLPLERRTAIMPAMGFVDLVQSLRGWSKTSTHDGVQLISPDPHGGIIQVHERVPLRPVATIIADLARDEWGAREAPVLGTATVFVTLEGEHAVALVVKAVGRNGEIMERAVALVVGDDYGVLVEGTSDTAHAEMLCRRVRWITEYYFLALGETRRRRYEYDAPKGWLALPRAHSIRWYHPEHPRNGVMLQVFDARPTEISAPEVEDRILFLDNTSFLRQEPPNPPQPFQTPMGIVGQVVRSAGQKTGVPVTLLDAWLTDGRFGYSVQLEARSEQVDAMLPIFTSVVESVRPVPVSRTKVSSTSLIHWAE